MEWKKYEGQFKEGNIKGFGNLFLVDGAVITGYWNNGKPQFFTRIKQGII